jgi:hypothetical protein
MSNFGRQFYKWNDYIHDNGPMPVGGDLWGGRIGQAGRLPA